MQSPILARSPTSPKPVAWRQELRQAFRRADLLLDHLEIEPSSLPHLNDTAFPILAPRPFVSRMRKGDPTDPLLRQVLPDPGELETVPGFTDDPVGDRASRVERGLLHKYRGRLLLISTGACAIHCRYCFRQTYPYAQDHFHPARIGQLLDYLDRNPDIEEIILSGGDPLMLGNRKLRRLTDALAAVPHFRRLRIHSRMPVTLPARVDDAFLEWLGNLDQQVVVVVHANHANEFDPAVSDALSRMRAAGATVLNQAVLLAGVNDNVSALARLMETGFAAGALPYYLHLLDRVSGSAHFEVDRDRAVALVDALRERLPGYLVPRLVEERAGAPSKLQVV